MLIKFITLWSSSFETKLKSVPFFHILRIIPLKCSLEPLWNDAYGQILKVYKIAEMENFKKEIFELINPLDYDYKYLSEKKKIEWICKNFEQTQKILEEKK